MLLNIIKQLCLLINKWICLYRSNLIQDQALLIIANLISPKKKIQMKELIEIMYYSIIKCKKWSFRILSQTC